MELITYLINVLIFCQVLVFMYFYEISLRIPIVKIDMDYGLLSNDVILETFFYGVSFLFVFGVILTGFAFQFYTNVLILQYVLLVLYAYRVLSKKERVLTAICLSFLLVFFNSYLWESVLHFAEYTVNPMMIFNFRELIHLVVLPFLYSHYTVDKKPVLAKLRILLFINFLFSLLTLEVYPNIDSYRFYIPIFRHLVNLTHYINRCISLVMLLDMFTKNLKVREVRMSWFSGWLYDE